MLVPTFLITAAIAAQNAFATPIKARTPYTVKETHTAPRKWSNSGKAPGNAMLHLQIGLKQDNFDELERHLLEGNTFFIIHSCTLSHIS